MTTRFGALLQVIFFSVASYPAFSLLIAQKVMITVATEKAAEFDLVIESGDWIESDLRYA